MLDKQKKRTIIFIIKTKKGNKMTLLNSKTTKMHERFFRRLENDLALQANNKQYADYKKFVELLQKLGEEKLIASVACYKSESFHNGEYFYYIKKSSVGPIVISCREFLPEEKSTSYVQVKIPKLKYYNLIFDLGLYGERLFCISKDFIENKLTKQDSTLTPDKILSKYSRFMRER